MPRVLFVDDDENVLNSLKVMLYRQRHIWEMIFVQDSREALALFEGADSPDIVVTDLHIPGIGGSELLEKVMEIRPDTIRIVLSGNLDAQSLAKASKVGHQVIAKPCDPDRFRDILARAIYLKERLRGTAIESMLLRLGALPSVPVLYWEIVAEIHSKEPSLHRIGQCIAKDPGLTAKVLQMANVHAGAKTRISDICQAASALGLETMKNCVLLAEIFSNVDDSRFSNRFDVNALWKHGLRVADYAKKIATNLSDSQRAINDSYTGGLLHDLGLLILASNLPDEFNRVLDLACREHISLIQAERGILGATHAEIGGFLLDLWGLAEPVTQAICHHFLPGGLQEDRYEQFGVEDLTPLVAVHAANFFVEDETDCEYGKAELDMVFLERLKLEGRVDEWWELCRNLESVS